MDEPKKAIKKPAPGPRMLCNCAAFTLIEVTLAILILASALVILLGLQSSLLGLSAGDRQRQEAMLLARRILAAIEVAHDQTPGEKAGDGLQILEEYVDTKGLPADDLEQLRKFRVFLETAGIGQSSPIENQMGIPAIAADAMLRTSLVIAWGETPQDRLEVLYFEPNFALSQQEEEELEELDD